MKASHSEENNVQKPLHQHGGEGVEENGEVGLLDRGDWCESLVLELLEFGELALLVLLYQALDVLDPLVALLGSIAAKNAFDSVLLLPLLQLERVLDG